MYVTALAAYRGDSLLHPYTSVLLLGSRWLNICYGLYLSIYWFGAIVGYLET